MDISRPHVYQRQILATGKLYIGKHKGGDKYYIGGGKDYLKDYKLYVKDRSKDLIEEILEYVDDLSKLNEREEYYLKQVDAARNPLYYNKTNRSSGPLFHSEEVKIKMGLSRKGQKRSEEMKQKLSKSKTGLKLGKYKTRKDKGIKFSKEHCEAISKGSKGISRGKGRTVTWKTGPKLGTSKPKGFGKIISILNKGRKLSKETKLKISATKKLNHAKLRTNN